MHKDLHLPQTLLDLQTNRCRLHCLESLGIDDVVEEEANEDEVLCVKKQCLEVASEVNDSIGTWVWDMIQTTSRLG